MLDRYQLAVAFRNSIWFNEKHQADVLAFERTTARRTSVDAPQGFSSSIPSIWEVTCPVLAIFRLHGRNAPTWDRKGLTTFSERFDYKYPKEELLDEIGFPLTPIRMKCAILGLGVLKVALHRSKGTPLPDEWQGLDFA
jgi:hypothetical protein